MRKVFVLLFVVLLLTQCFGQQTASEPVKLSGCLMNMNGRFRLMTQGHTYVLKGHQSELFSYNGMLVEVTGTVDAHSKSQQAGIPIVFHVTAVKKLAETCS